MDKTNIKTNEVREEQIDDFRNPDTIAPFYAQRGLRTCIFDGWRVFALHYKKYLCRLLPISILVGAAASFFLWMLCRLYADHIVPAMLYIRAGNEETLVWQQFAPTFVDYAWLAVSCLVALAGLVLGKGVLWTQIRSYSQTDALESRNGLRPAPEMWRMSFKVLKYNVAVYSLILVLSALFVLISLLTGWYYLALAVIPVYLFVSVVAIPGRSACVVENKPLTHALRTTWQLGRRHWGGYFLIMLLTAIPLFAAALVLLLPYAPIPLAHFADVLNLHMEEASGLPRYIVWVGWIVAAIALGGIFLISTFQTWAFAFKSATTFSGAQKASPSATENLSARP